VLAVANPHSHPVTATIRFSAPTARGDSVAPYESGSSATFTIEPEGVLQIGTRPSLGCEPDFVEPEPIRCNQDRTCTYGYCALPDLDLTGTEIVASDPVAVFGAHDCAFVPYNRWGCDHLEEQIFPFETWGTRFVFTQSVRERGEPDVVRILSGADGNEVRFSPDVHEPVVLDRGEHVEFEGWGAFEIESDAPVLVGQFLVGQSYNGYPTGEELPPGDPSFSLVVPVEQYRTGYNFLAHDSFDQSYVNITAAEAAVPTLRLDGADLQSATWQQVGETEFVTARLEIDPGSHSLTSELVDGQATVGLTVYGYGQYASYMYPGGLALEPIAVW
jgi:hypothetical protein